MEKYIRNISELNLKEKITSGSCSDIYLYESNTYFKHFNEDYRDLTDEINIEFLETIKTISEIKNTHLIIKAIDIYRSKTKLFGYIMNKLDAKPLEEISDDTLIVDLINSFENLKKDVRILANNYVKTEDIGGDNILYNGNLYLLDLDLSLIDKRYIPDELYIKTIYSIFKSLLLRIIGKTYYQSHLFDDERNLYLGNNDDYKNYLDKVVYMSSNILEREVSTISDIKKAYQKIYK